MYPPVRFGVLRIFPPLGGTGGNHGHMGLPGVAAVILYAFECSRFRHVGFRICWVNSATGSERQDNFSGAWQK
jgi:hypothetical protein